MPVGAVVVAWVRHLLAASADDAGREQGDGLQDASTDVILHVQTKIAHGFSTRRGSAKAATGNVR